ncbi:unnamed protein product [Larinioides sclopetarius]
MDWASSQWKQELPPLAIQKINALEEKIERLQKERQQKQLQCECLELALEKEKRKVENEKQQTIASQRELQSLADVCKDFEDKQQRLQNEIQNRDNRIASLEGLLSQAKKENCRLQQLENDLKELRGVRETTLLEREQKNESYNSGQNAELQEKKINLLSDSLSENSEMSILAEKENNKYALNENDLLSSLRKKISDQEKTIQELILKLASISDKENTKELHRTYSKTPGRPQMESVEASPALRNKSVWNSFTTTPAKENKETVLRHHNDSVSTGSTDEKLMALQARLKQLCQELDCQRHNFEASKVSMEQKFKEKENALKAELKYQAQANADLDKELKEIRNKYQQEINQSTKKLDMLTAQLKKTEETKVILEKEVKNMESKIKACALSLKAKEEEAQDLQKLKNMADATIQSLQAQVRDLEKKCKNVQEQNSSLNETVKALELQLDGSCNLARERETDLAKVKKEFENLSISHKNILDENQELRNRIVTAQTKTEEFLQNEVVLKEQVELMEKEQNQLTDKLHLEMKKSQELTLVVEEQKSQMSLQNEELSLMESKLTVLNKEFTVTKLELQEKISDLDNKLNHAGKENMELIQKLKECSSRENLLMEKLEGTENEKTELLDKLAAEMKKLQELETNMAEDKQVISHLKEELSIESAKNNELSIRLSASKKEYEAQIQALETNLSTVERDYTALENKIKELSLNELSLKEKLELIEKEKEEVTSRLKTENDSRLSFESAISDLNDQIKSLKEESAAKSLENTELRNTCESLTTEFKTQIQALETNLSTAERDYTALENKIKELSLNESSLKEKLELIEKEKEEVTSRLKTENDSKQSLESSISGLNDQIKSLREELAGKSLENTELRNTCESLETDFKAKTENLEEKLALSLSEVATLSNQLQSVSSNETMLKDQLQMLERDKKELENRLTAETENAEKLLAKEEELKTKILSLERDLSCSSAELEKTNQLKEASMEEVKVQIQHLEINLSTSQKECAGLENKLKEYSLAESSLKEKLEQIGNEKEEAVSQLAAEKNLKLNLESSVLELSNQIKLLEEEKASKSLEVDELKKRIADMINEYEAKIQQLEINLNTSQKEFTGLEDKLKEYSLAELPLKEKLEQIGNEKQEVVSQLAAEKSARLNLESSVLELNNQMKLLEEEKAMKSLEVEELKKRIADLMIEHEEYERKSSELLAVQKQLESVSLNEKSLLNKLQVLEKEKEDFSSNLADESSKITSLLADNEKQRSDILSLQEELSAKTLELDSLNRVKEALTEELNAKIQDLSTKLSSMEAECTVSKIELKNCLLEQSYAEEKMKIMEENNIKLNEDLSSEISKSEHLQCSLEELKINLSCLEEELSLKSAQLEEVTASQAEYEEKIQELLVGSNSDQSKHSLLESQLQEYKLNEIALNDQIEALRKQGDLLFSRLGNEIEETRRLRMANEDKESLISALNKELADKCLEIDRLSAEMECLKKLYEVDVQDLQIKLIDAETESDTIKSQIQRYKENESSLMKKIDLLNAAEQKVASSLNEEICKNQNLESIVKRLKQFILSLENDLSRMSEECRNIDQEFLTSQSHYEINIQKLENQLSAAEEKYSVLEIQLNNNLSYTEDMKEKLKFMEEEKAQMSSIITTESDRVVSLQEVNAKLHGEIVLLKEQISCQSLELANMRKTMENLNEHENKIEKLQKDLVESEAERINFQTQIDELFKTESSCEMEAQKLVAENQEIASHLRAEVQKTKELEKEVEAANVALKKEMDCKSLLLNDMAAEKAQFRAKLEELENKLLCSSIPKKLNGSFSKELRLDEKVASFCISSLEENLSLRSFEYDELSLENEILKEELERNIQELQDEISDVKSENEHLRVKMNDISLNAEMSQKRLELVEKEKEDLDRQLNFENKKIKMLESGIQELKKIILTLQVLLISYNGDIKGLNSEMAVSKDCSEFKDEVTLNNIATEKEYVSSIRAETESFPTFYFPEFKSFSSLPEKEFSAALEKFSFYSLNQICSLENNLISKLERCKFLCRYQLIDRVQLNEVWKLFVFLRRKLRQIQLLKKFMFCFCNILKSSLVAHILHSVNKVALVKVFPKNFGFTLKDFLYLCNNAFNKILFSVSQTFEKDSSLVNRRCAFFIKYSDIHSNALHLPVVKRTIFVLCETKLQRVCRDLKPRHASTQRVDDIFFARKQDIKKALNALKAQEVPFFLNFAMSVMEKIGKVFYHSSDDLNDATSGHFSTSAFQMKNYLSLLEPSSPIFQILSKYCIDILNLENIAVHDICYWKHHCNILGIDRCDVQKMITLLEHMAKHKRGENGLGSISLSNKHAKEEVTIQKSEESVEQCLKIEKEKQKLLNIAIEEIEKDLGETFLQKEKFKTMALNVGKMLCCLKKCDTDNLVFSNMQLDGVEICNDACFCEKCVMDEDMSDGPSHLVLTLDHCLKWVERLINSGCQLEKEVCELKKDESELKTLSRRLKDKNSELEMTVDQCNKNLEAAHNQIQGLIYDLQKQKEKYEFLSQSVNEKDTLIMQLQAENGILLNSIDEYKTKLKVLEDEVSSLSINQEKLEFSLLCKDKEIESLKETFDENVSLLNETKRKCEEYRNEIHLLNSRISKYEEEKMIDQHMSQNLSFDNSFVPDDLVKSSKTVINELQAKVDSLTKANNSLNLTIENIEEELKNVYMEKKSVVEELEKLSEQIAYFKQEISVSTQNYIDEKNSKENLLLRLKENEKLVLDNERIIKQLKTKNETLEKNASLIKNLTKEHEQVVSKKNSDLTRCRQVIEKLQTQIAELEQENSNLKDQTKVIKRQEGLKHQLNEIISQKSELEKEIARLKLVETEKIQTLERLSEANLERDNLTEQIHQLTLEFETQKKKNTDLETKCTELDNFLKDAINSNTSLEKELDENKNIISILNKQLEESTVELKNKRTSECELMKEISVLKSAEKHLTQEIESITKNLKDAKDNVKAERNKNQLLMKENETLRVNGRMQANIGTELQKLRNTLSGAYNFTASVLNTILCAVQSYPENTDFEELRCSLTALIVQCTQNSEKEFPMNMLDQLNSFFGTLINNHKDDLVICGLVSSIKDSVKSIASMDEPFHGAETSLVISPDTVCNMSVFESTFVKQTNNHSRNISADLKYIKAQTDEVIFSFKKIISKKTEEIEKLKKELKQIPFTSTKNESKPTELDKTSFKWKYELIKRQYRQLEEKYNAVIVSSEQMEKTIETLEAENKRLQAENKNLEAEAEELSDEIKNLQAYYSNSDELLEALTELNALRHKLKEVENENRWLQKEIQEFQMQQKSAEKLFSSADFNSLRHKLKELENENNWLRKRLQEFQLQQTSAGKPSPTLNQRQTQIPKFDKTYLKENSVNR